MRPTYAFRMPAMSFGKAQNTIVREVVLYTCDDAGLVELFGKDKKRGLAIDDIARSLKVPDVSTRLLLLNACAFGFLRKRNGKYYAKSELFRQCYFSTEFEMRAFASFLFLPESCRKATNAGLQVIPGDGATLYDRMVEHPALEAYYAEGLAEAADAMRAPLVLAALEGIGERFTHVLDVGGGAGVNARRITQAYPRARVTVFDLPSVAASAVSVNNSDQITFVGGDAFSDPFPAADCVVFSAFLEVVPEERFDELLAKARAALPDDGALIVVQAFCDDDESGPIGAAMTSLYFFNFTAPRTYVRPVAEVRMRAERVGFRDIEVIPGDDGLLKAVVLRT